MPKCGEIDYVRKLTPEALRHARHKPFSDPRCGAYLMDLGAVLTLLPPPPARVLDLGVGTGWTSVLLARRGYEVVAQDLAPDMIALARRSQPAGVEFRVCDYEQLDYQSEFDAALFYDSLHHAEDEQAALGSIYRALRPDGVCVTVEPGTGHAQAAAAVAQRFGVTEKDMPPAHIIALARRCGFRDFRVYPRPDFGTHFIEVPVVPVVPGLWANVRWRLRQLAKAVVGPGRERRALLRGSHLVKMCK